MIKTSLSTGALPSVDRRSPMTAGYSSLAFIYCVLFCDSLCFWRQGENFSPILSLFTGVTCYCNMDSCMSGIMTVNC